MFLPNTEQRNKRARQQAEALSRRAERAEAHARLMAQHAEHRAEQARKWGAFMDALEMSDAGFGPTPVPPNGRPPMGFRYLVAA